MHFLFHPFGGQRRDVLPRGKRLHFRLLALLLALAGQFVLEESVPLPSWRWLVLPEMILKFPHQFLST